MKTRTLQVITIAGVGAVCALLIAVLGLHTVPTVVSEVLSLPDKE